MLIGGLEQGRPGLVSCLSREGDFTSLSNTGKSCYFGHLSSSLGALKDPFSSDPETCPSETVLAMDA